MDRTIYFGPPGTGKTSTLLERLEVHLREGVPPERIAFLSFTRRARHEAVTRTADVLGIQAKELPYFRTIHSMAYRALRLSDGDVLGRPALREFGTAMGLEFGHSAVTEQAAEGIAAQSKGDHLLAIDNLARLRGCPPKEVWREAQSQYPWPEVQHFCASYARFKTEHAMLDFTDVLAEYCARGSALPVDVVFVDEAQDLSLLQWKAVARACAEASVQYVAGDDDQAIYRWAGADVSVFTGLEGQRIVLGHSYRMPKSVFALSQRLAARIKGRVPKEFSSREADGLVQRTPALAAIPAAEVAARSTTQGLGWLFLVRNRFMLPEIAEWLLENGVVFGQQGGSSINAKEAAAIYTWERLRKGRACSATDIRALYALLLTRKQIKHGCKALPTMPDDEDSATLAALRAEHGLLINEDLPWFEVLQSVPLARRTYYRTLLRKHGSLRLPATVQIETIHGSKGAEAENVVLFTRCSKRTWESAHESGTAAANDEHRVWYVGATRTKERLILVENTGNFGYRLP